jgi:hypothetical protein
MIIKPVAPPVSPDTVCACPEDPGIMQVKPLDMKKLFQTV